MSLLTQDDAEPRFELYTLYHNLKKHTLERRYSDLRHILENNTHARTNISLFPNVAYHFNQQHLVVAYNFVSIPLHFKL